MNTNNDTVLCLPCHWVMPCKKLELKISWKKFLKFPLLTTISAINILCLNNYQKILNSPHIFQNCVVAFFSRSKAAVHWFPLTMNENRDFYWNYPEQTWSRFKWNVDIYWCMHTKIYLYTSISNYSCIIISDKSDKSLVMYSSVLVTLAVSQEFI